MWIGPQSLLSLFLLWTGRSYSFHFYWRLLVLSLGLFGLWFLVSSITGWIKRARSTMQANGISPGKAEELIARALPWKNVQVGKTMRTGLKLSAAFVLGWVIGMLQRDRELSRPPWVYTDVLVVKRYDARSYLLNFPGIGNKPFVTCQDVDWAPGEKMKQLVPVQRLGCKDVAAAGWFQFWIDDETGKRIIFREKEVAHVGY